jgi:hypothetical protein
MHQVLKAMDAHKIDLVTLEATSGEPGVIPGAVDAIAPDLSRYCPHGLFSRQPALVRQALYALALSPPQNNFRVFFNGLTMDEWAKASGAVSVVDASAMAGAADSAQRLESVLGTLPVFKSLVKSADSHAAVSASDSNATPPPRVAFLCEIVASILCRDPILSRLRTAQELERAVVEAKEDQVYRAKQTYQGVVDELLAYVDGIRRVQDPCDGLAAVESEIARLCQSDAPDSLACCLRDFYIAATAKDVSLLVTFRVSRCSSANGCTPDEEAGCGENCPVDLFGTAGNASPETSTRALGDEHVKRHSASMTVPLPPCPSSPTSDSDSVAATINYSLAIVDVDPKPFARLPWYRDLEWDVQRAYTLLGERTMEKIQKCCVYSLQAASSCVQ